MTIIVARRFGDRIVIASDTMVESKHDVRPDIVPGRLKAIVLSPAISVAYAGLSLQAIDAIRRTKKALEKGGGLVDVEATLAATTDKYHNELDFVLASHANGPELKKIWNGQISGNLRDTAIGQTDLVKIILEEERGAPKGFIPNENEEEAAFLTAFRSLFWKRGVQLAAGVGGFAVFLLGSPYGHCYFNHAGVLSWERRIIGVPETQEQRSNRLTGATEWRYNIQTPNLRGVAIVGALLLRAGVGYIYSPLEDDEPVRCPFTPSDGGENDRQRLAEFVAEVNRRAEAIGGGVAVDFGPPKREPPSKEQIDQILAHASAAPHRTTVTRVENGFRIECSAPNFGQNIHLDFSQMQYEPVGVACGTIDRLNVNITENLAKTRPISE